LSVNVLPGLKYSASLVASEGETSVARKAAGKGNVIFFIVVSAMLQAGHWAGLLPS
jgi:hypothetical protein